MDINWDEAPEGATHYDTDYGVFCNERGFWRQSGLWVPDNEQHEWGTIRYIQRPVQWTGEGLPPVGTLCEAQPWKEHDAPWKKMTTIAHWCAPNGITYSWCHSGYGTYEPQALRFRPLRTPDQIAAEERESEVSHIERCITNLKVEHQNNPRVIAEVLHNIGYRKQEIN